MTSTYAPTIGDQRLHPITRPDLVDGFADDPFTRTWPPSQIGLASGRVFTRGTAHQPAIDTRLVGCKGTGHASQDVTRGVTARVESALIRRTAYGR